MELNDIFKRYFKPVKEEPSKLNYSVCKNCARCCNAMGCQISPDDLIEISVDSIINLINETNCISIDWWEGDPRENREELERTFFLRIRNEDANIVDPSYRGKCCILTDIGCPLSYSYRPKGARELIPSENDDCHDGYSKRQCCIDWLEYNDILEKVYYHFCKLERDNCNNEDLLDKYLSILLGGIFDEE